MKCAELKPSNANKLELFALVFYNLTTFHFGAQRNKKNPASENLFNRLLQVCPECAERL
jgi:hypothetical protein